MLSELLVENFIQLSETHHLDDQLEVRGQGRLQVYFLIWTLSCTTFSTSWKQTGSGRFWIIQLLPRSKPKKSL